MERPSTSMTFPIGSALPAFNLPNVDGGSIGSDYLAGALASVVVFTCNHCPYVKGSDEALVAVAHEFQPKGIRFIAISSNDATQYPEDSFEKMKEKAKTMKLPFPYLYDESQSIAKTFDAACTPECYVFDGTGKLVFHGTINNSPRDPTKVTEPFLKTALTQLLSGSDVTPSFVHPIGCSIKWSN